MFCLKFSALSLLLLACGQEKWFGIEAQGSGKTQYERVMGHSLLLL